MNLFKKLFYKSTPPEISAVKNKIKIAIEIDTFDKGGLQKVVLDSALQLNPEKYYVIIICVNGGGYWFNVARQKGVKVYTLDAVRKTKQYQNILIENQIDIACSHFSRVGYPVFKSLGIMNITFIHNVYAFMPPNIIQNFQADDQLVNLYISVSNNATRYAVNCLGIKPEKIITIANGLIIKDYEKNTPIVDRQQFGLKQDDYVFLNVASYNLHKGHYLMAEAIKKIKKIRKDIKLICIGNEIYPPHVKEFRKYLIENELEDCMLMPGYFTNVESFYKMSDAFLLPSYIEGWSIAMNEAMFYKKPMILTDTGGAAEVIENNDIGMLIPNEYGDVTNLDSKLLDNLAYEKREFKITQDLVTAMIEFADHRDYWLNAGKKGHDKIRANYDFSKVISQYESIFEKIYNESLKNETNDIYKDIN